MSGAKSRGEGTKAAGDRSSKRPIRAATITFAALLSLATAPALAIAGAARAHAARTINLRESARLRLSSHHGFTLNEVGSATGTVTGRIYIHLTVSSTNHVTAEVGIYPSGGSLTGYASASYHVHGALATFNGTMSIARGTGSYRRARGSGLSFTGTIQRSTDAVTVYLSGRMSA
jgi:hypothetical protein